MKISVLYFLVLISLVLAEQMFKYDGYKVYRVTPKTIEEAKLIGDFEKDGNFDFWSDIRMLDVPVDIMVTPSGQDEFEATMEREDINYTIFVDNVEEIVDREINRIRPRVERGDVTFEEYMRHDEINAYLERLAADYPSIVKTEVIGRSFEGRNLILIRISSGGSNKPTIFAEAAIHAREWIAPPVALYLINQLVENPENAYMYQDVDWAIIPVINPDGYEYTHTSERFWRKTRSVGTICNGVDGNRNFDAFWTTIGASIWQCDITYAGHRVFSEVETQAVRNYILRHKDDIKLYLDIHSYGRWFLHPWGHITDDPDNIDELIELGRLFNDAIHSVNGENYTVTSFANGLYFASGTSVDWAKLNGIDLAYTIELPAGGTGFDPPPSSIIPTVEETWEGFKAIHSFIQNKFVN